MSDPNRIPPPSEDSRAGQSSYHPSRSSPDAGPHRVNRGAVPAMPVGPNGQTLTPSREKQSEDYSFMDALKMINMDSFRTFSRQPCVREPLLTSIGVGFAFMGIMIARGRNIQSACNWAVGTGVGVSMPGYFICQNRRYKELAGVQQIVDTLDRKKAEQARRYKEAEEKRAREAEEAEAERRRQQWWKFW